MAISPEDIERVRDATDLVALISETVALKRVGQRWSGLCPFHGEKTASFYVTPTMGRYHCFGCQASGDAITWVREVQRLDFIDAVRFLADKAHVEIKEDAAGGAQRKERNELLEVMQKAVEWYHEQLLTNPEARPARDYLRSRGINGDVARQFKLGFAPDRWDSLVTTLNLQNRQLEGTGLGFVNKTGRRQDALRNRIIFPIFDPSGKAIAVGGRIIPPPPGAPPLERAEAKYKNSPETPIYAKRKTLYALNWAKEDVVKSGEIIVCEGYTDVIAFFQAGLPRAVATCGTALGEDHFRAMKNFANRIVLAYDADSAGQNAAASVYQWEKQHNVDVAVARFPGGMDPAELAQEDPEALKSAIENAIPFMQFRLERALESANLAHAEGRAKGAELALQVIAEHPSDLVRDQYLLQIADRLQLNVATLRLRLAELVRRPVIREEMPVVERTVDEPPLDFNPLETPRPGLEALRLVFAFEDVARRRLSPSMFVDATQRRAFSELDGVRTVSAVIDELRGQGEFAAAALLSLVSVDYADRAYEEADIDAVIIQLVRGAASEALRSIERELRQGTIAPDVALATVRDVKQRLAELDGPNSNEALKDLVAWLDQRTLVG